jgi:hypothetical protein
MREDAKEDVCKRMIHEKREEINKADIKKKKETRELKKAKKIRRKEKHIITDRRETGRNDQ